MFIAINKNKKIVRSEEAVEFEEYYCQSCKEKVSLKKEPFPVYLHKRGSKCERHIQKLSLWHYLMDQMFIGSNTSNIHFTNKHPFDRTKKINQAGYYFKLYKHNDQESKTIYVLDCLNQTFYESNRPNVIQVSEILKNQALEIKEKEYYWGLMPSYLRKKPVGGDVALYLHVSLNYFIKVRQFGCYNSLVGEGVSLFDFIEDYRLKSLKDNQFHCCLETHTSKKDYNDVEERVTETSNQILIGCK
jgi:hypothetical protein